LPLKGAGYDKVDVHACSAREPPILVSNTPSAVDDATADVNMFLIIGALRNFNPSILSLRAGKWRGEPPPALGHDPRGKVLGILGMGGIGRNLKRKAEPFGMRVIYHNRRKLHDDIADGAEYVSFDELLEQSDVISLNLPLNVRLHYAVPPLLSSLPSPIDLSPFWLDLDFQEAMRQKRRSDWPKKRPRNSLN
jgi:glyoxylate reductase